MNKSGGYEGHTAIGGPSKEEAIVVLSEHALRVVSQNILSLNARSQTPGVRAGAVHLSTFVLCHVPTERPTQSEDLQP
jgi:hypothetical protein